jgi:hypothetical protein
MSKKQPTEPPSSGTQVREPPLREQAHEGRVSDAPGPEPSLALETASQAPPPSPEGLVSTLSTEGPPREQAVTPREVPAVQPRPVWRTIAFAKQARQVYFGGVLVPVLGGEFIEHPPHVEALRGDGAFEFIEVSSPEELAALKERHAHAVEEVRKFARELGLVVYRDGESPRSR